jgi:FixJ family two-component response regulator
MQAGAVTFFQKPVDDELLFAVRKALDVARRSTLLELNPMFVL